MWDFRHIHQSLGELFQKMRQRNRLERQREIMQLMVEGWELLDEGKSKQEIASVLKLTPRGVAFLDFLLEMRAERAKTLCPVCSRPEVEHLIHKLEQR